MRDYNKEFDDNDGRKYGYSFDYDVMHPFMVKSFESFFNKGNLLELGSFKGEFTKRLLPFFEDVTCVEASDIAMRESKDQLGDRVSFVNALFEKVTLPSRYDNIVMTHVLEHLDDPVAILKRVNDEWLAPEGRFFLVCFREREVLLYVSQKKSNQFSLFFLLQSRLANVSYGDLNLIIAQN